MIDILGELDDVLVLMSSHVMEDVVDVVDDLIVLHDGRVLFDGTVAEFAGRAPEGAARPLEASFLATIGHA